MFIFLRLLGGIASSRTKYLRVCMLSVLLISSAQIQAATTQAAPISLPDLGYNTPYSVVIAILSILLIVTISAIIIQRRKIHRLTEHHAVLDKINIDLQEQVNTQRELEYNIEERNLELEVAMRELTDANKELERLSAIDALTGLMNRRYFDKRLLAETRRSRREQRPLSLAMLDIDFFKKVNDDYGHVAGDEALKAFAKLLQRQVKRPTDTICRFGGEEFVIILPATKLEDASVLMEKIRTAAEQMVICAGGFSFSITVSIGLTSRIMASDDEQGKILETADKLLYASKTSGRNQVTVKVMQAA